MNKIRKGDEVIVITGSDKGKKGIVLSVLEQGQRLLVDGINLKKKHKKGNPNKGESGGIISKAMPIHRSNVMVYDATHKKGTRIRIKRLEDGKRVRVSQLSDQVIDVKS